VQAAEARRERAWDVARRAAGLLRERYGATRVVVFGSLVRPDEFWPLSDVDLAAWGVASDQYLEAFSRTLDLTTDFSIDLVRGEEARRSVCQAIETESVPV
jgi:predicted nucleotidyltransferase